MGCWSRARLEQSGTTAWVKSETAAWAQMFSKSVRGLLIRGPPFSLYRLQSFLPQTNFCPPILWKENKPKGRIFSSPKNSPQETRFLSHYLFPSLLNPFLLPLPSLFLFLYIFFCFLFVFSFGSVSLPLLSVLSLYFQKRKNVGWNIMKTFIQDD